MKRFISILLALVTSLAICTSSVSANESNVAKTSVPNNKAIAYEVMPTATTDDGWTSGSFYNSYTTGIKYFSGGTIYVTISSSSSASGNYYVELYKSGLSQGKLPIPCNGVTTVNFPNQSAGQYRLFFSTPSNFTTIQSYEIIGYGSI